MIGGTSIEFHQLREQTLAGVDLLDGDTEISATFAEVLADLIEQEAQPLTAAVEVAGATRSSNRGAAEGRAIVVFCWGATRTLRKAVKLLAWNIQHGGGASLARIVEEISAYDRPGRPATRSAYAFCGARLGWHLGLFTRIGDGKF